MGEGDLQGFLPPSLEFCGLYGRRVPSEGPQIGQDPVTLNV